MSDAPTDEAPGRASGLTRRFRAPAYVTAVTVAGGAVTALSAVAGVHDGLGPAVAAWVALLALLVGGELLKIRIPAGDGSEVSLTLGSVFGVAALLVGPLWGVVAAQTLALLVDPLRGRASWRHQPFNVAQLALAYAAADVVYRHDAGWPHHLATPGVRPLWAVLAGLVFVAANTALVAGVVTLTAGRVVLREFGDDVRRQLVYRLPATALSAAIAACAVTSLWLLLFEMLPIVGVYASLRIASRREHEALHDPLTGLGNRTRLAGQLDRLTHGGEPGAVLLVDVDHFKDVNEALGHRVGDELLRAVGALLTEVVGDRGDVNRLGADEYAVLLRRGDPAEVADQVLVAMRRPHELSGLSVRMPASIGIARHPRDGRTGDELLRRAEVALAEAKRTRDSHATYASHLEGATFDTLQLANDLSVLLGDPARARIELVLAYQPLVVAATGRLHGVEALVRWQHPRLGTLMPGQFLPLAEHAGLISAVGRVVLDLAVAQIRSWEQEGHAVTVSVNASVPELSDTGFPGLVATTLATHGVEPSRLVVEVTENAFIGDANRSSDILQRIRSTGARVSIDDYGSGYSSLAYVKKLDVDELKIDREFAGGVARHRTDRVIVESTIELAHRLGLVVVAEGVEDLETAQVLRGLGCDVLQGYGLGRPGPPDAISALCRAGGVADLLVPAQPGADR